MRTDVKLGVVVAMVVVLVSGGYYMYRNKQQQPIPLGNEVAAAKPKPAIDKPGSGPRQPSQGQRNSPSLAQRTPAQRPAVTQDRNTSRSEQVSPGGVRPGRPNPAVSQPNRRPAGPDGLTPAQRLAQRPDRGEAKPQPGPVTPASRDGVTPGQPTLAQPETVASNTATPTPAGDAAAARPTVQLPPVPGKTADATPPERRTVPLTATRQESAALEKHRVQSGDTLAALAIQYYGSERYTQFLIDANKQLANPNRLKIGDVVNIPAAPERANASRQTTTPRSTTGGAAPAQPTGRRTYTVQSGDSFYAIARDQLGDAGRWNELFELNRQLVGGEPTALRVGQVLVLPN